MPTSRQDQEFAEEMQGCLDRIIMSSTSLDTAINYIANHLEPDDVFTEKQLIAWAEDNGYVKE